MQSFARLVEQFEGRLFNFLLRRVGVPADAEDLTQETFVRAWERIGQYDPQWRFSTWLFTIGARLAAGRARAARVPAVGFGHEDNVAWARLGRAGGNGEPTTWQGSATDAVEAGRRLWDLARHVLNDDQYTALWLRYAEDLAPREIACVLGRSAVGVRVMLFRARAALWHAAKGMEGRITDRFPGEGASGGSSTVRSRSASRSRPPRTSGNSARRTCRIR